MSFVYFFYLLFPNAMDMIMVRFNTLFRTNWGGGSADKLSFNTKRFKNTF